jgi:oligoendopeptidase F
MFAEFEQICHKMVSDGRPLTVESLRKTYRELLDTYFGPTVHIAEIDDLEGLRIPHFYRSFYVYKYATGIAAAIALSDKLVRNPEKNRDSYLSFLKSGGSQFPLESLRIAGVDMSTPAPVQAAVDVFDHLVTDLESYFA